MLDRLDLRRLAYAIVLTGTLGAFAVAVVPHYTAGYRLHALALIVGVLPYVVYAALSEVLRGWSLVLPGLALVTVDLGVKVNERFLAYDGYSSGAVFYVPLGLAAALVAVGVTRGRWSDPPD